MPLAKLTRGEGNLSNVECVGQSVALFLLLTLLSVVRGCRILLLKRFTKSLTSTGIPRKLSAFHTLRSGGGVGVVRVWPVVRLRVWVNVRQAA
jgi:hypothetical protein